MSSKQDKENQQRVRKFGLMEINLPEDGTLQLPETDSTRNNIQTLNKNTQATPKSKFDFNQCSSGVNMRFSVGEPRSSESVPARRNTLPPQFPTSGRESATPPPGGITRHHRATFPGGHADRDRPRYKLRWELNRKGRAPGQLRKPTDVCFIDSENLVVSEGKNSRLQIFGRGHQFCIDRTVAPDLVHPSSVCQSLDGYMMLVADMNQVHYFSLCGQQEEVWPPDLGRRGSDEFINITALGVDCADNLVLAECRKECTVGIYSQETGQPIRQCKLKSGYTYGEPSYITCDQKHGITYVSDSTKGCIHSFDKHGKHIGTFGDAPGRGDLICPLGMHLTDTGELYVADKGAHAVAVYSVPGGSGGGHGGNLLHHALTEQDGLRDPVAVSRSCRGSLAVAQHTMDYGLDSYAVKVYKRTLHA